MVEPEMVNSTYCGAWMLREVVWLAAAPELVRLMNSTPVPGVMKMPANAAEAVVSLRIISPAWANELEPEMEFTFAMNVALPGEDS